MSKEAVNETVSGQVSVLSEMVASMLQPILDDHGIGFGTFDLLAAVHAADGKLPQAAIARRMGISPASLTESVKTGVRRGLVQQVERDGDMRAKTLTLTPAGRRLLELCFKRLDEVEFLMGQNVSRDEMEITLRVLRQGIQNLLKVGHSL